MDEKWMLGEYYPVGQKLTESIKLIAQRFSIDL
jgi:hypothetical protein